MPTTPSAVPMLLYPFRPLCSNLLALLARPLGASPYKLLRRTIRAMPKFKHALTFCCPFCRNGEMNRPNLVHRAWLDSRGRVASYMTPLSNGVHILLRIFHPSSFSPSSAIWLNPAAGVPIHGSSALSWYVCNCMHSQTVSYHMMGQDINY